MTHNKLSIEADQFDGGRCRDLTWSSDWIRHVVLGAQHAGHGTGVRPRLVAVVAHFSNSTEVPSFASDLIPRVRQRDEAVREEGHILPTNGCRSGDALHRRDYTVHSAVQRLEIK